MKEAAYREGRGFVPEIGAGIGREPVGGLAVETAQLEKRVPGRRALKVAATGLEARAQSVSGHHERFTQNESGHGLSGGSGNGVIACKVENLGDPMAVACRQEHFARWQKGQSGSSCTWLMLAVVRPFPERRIVKLRCREIVRTVDSPNDKTFPDGKSVAR